MKRKQENLFQDKIVLIPIEETGGDEKISFWEHRSKAQERTKKVITSIEPSNASLKGKSWIPSATIKLSAHNKKHNRSYTVRNAEYFEIRDNFRTIELIFKRKKKLAEKILANLRYIKTNILRAPNLLTKAFTMRHLVNGFIDMCMKRENERLSALSSFWSSRLGTFIFSTSADAVAILLILPLLIFRKTVYMVDIPNVERLGHAVANIDVLQAEFSKGFYKTKRGKRVLVVFYPQISLIEDIGFEFFPRIKFIQHLIKCCRSNDVRILSLHPWIEKVVKRALSKTGSILVAAKPAGHRDIFNLVNKTPPLFSLSKSDERICFKYFEDIKCKLERPLVICSNRSTGNINFRGSKLKSLSEHKRYAYRNTPFEALIPSVKFLLAKGYCVIRVGSPSGSNSLSDVNYFDLSAQPTSQKNILLDLFLFSRCLFFFGDTSGNYSLAQAFRKPICFLNFAPFGHFHSWSENSISIFKNVKNQRTGKLEKFSNLLKYEHGYEVHNDKADLTRRYVSNTKKENLETVKEMEARISGGLYDSNEHLQRRFQKLFIPSYLHQSVNSKCGNYFLEKYEHLLK